MKEEKEKPKIFILYRKNVALGKKNKPLICVFCDFVVFLQNILEL